MLLWNSFLLAFSALLPLINPCGSALVFIGLAGEAPPETYRSLARRIAVNNVIFLGIFELLGSAILNFFGISLPIVQVAGGIVIAAIGWGVLNEKDSQASARDKREAAVMRSEDMRANDTLPNLEKKLFYPFTFPVTSGPGTLVVLITLSARFADRVRLYNILGHAGLFLAIVVLSAMVYVCYAYAPRITRAISPATAHGILRVIGFIVICIGVQIGWNGLTVLLHSLRP